MFQSHKFNILCKIVFWNKFMKGVADGLLLAENIPNHTPRRSKEKRSLSPVPKAGKKPMVPKPVTGIHYDELHHWREFEFQKNRYRVCSILAFASRSKCKIYLCLQEESFSDFHNQITFYLHCC